MWIAMTQIALVGTKFCFNQQLLQYHKARKLSTKGIYRSKRQHKVFLDVIEIWENKVISLCKHVVLAWLNLIFLFDYCPVKGNKSTCSFVKHSTCAEFLGKFWKFIIDNKCISLKLPRIKWCSLPFHPRTK